jgi:hypothetical protein
MAMATHTNYSSGSITTVTGSATSIRTGDDTIYAVVS